MKSIHFLLMNKKSNQMQINEICHWNEVFDDLIDGLASSKKKIEEIEKHNAKIVDVIDQITFIINQSFNVKDKLSKNAEKRKKIIFNDNDIRTKKKKSRGKANDCKHIDKIDRLTKKKSYPFNKKDCYPFQIGYKGEAYVYEHLMEIGLFKKVDWKAKTDNTNCPSILLKNDHQYFIEDFGEHFDILAEDRKGKKYYFEIKSTNGFKRQIQIKKCQEEYAQYINGNGNYYIIVIVKNVLGTPLIEYYEYVQGKKPFKITFDANFL